MSSLSFQQEPGAAKGIFKRDEDKSHSQMSIINAKDVSFEDPMEAGKHILKKRDANQSIKKSKYESNGVKKKSSKCCMSCAL